MQISKSLYVKREIEEDIYREINGLNHDLSAKVGIWLYVPPENSRSP